MSIIFFLQINNEVESVLGIYVWVKEIAYEVIRHYINFDQKNSYNVRLLDLSALNGCSRKFELKIDSEILSFIHTDRHRDYVPFSNMFY